MASQTVTGLPSAVDLVLYQGDDTYLDLSVTSSGSPADLTGCTAKCQIRVNPAATAVLAELDATIAGSVIHLHLSHTDAAGLLPGAAVWDCQLTDSAGNVSTVAAGAVTVAAEVTR